MNVLQNFAPIGMGSGNSMIRTGASLVLVSELLLTQLAISSPHLHHWLHGADPGTDFQHDHCASHGDSEDAQEAEHVCAIFLMAAGISSEEGALEIHPSKAISESLPPSAPHLAGEPAMARHLARGPPHRFR